MNEDKITELRSKLRKAMQTGAAEASNCCRELITALKAEDLSTWEPELCLLLLEMPHLRPEQIPEKVEKLYFDLSYLREKLPQTKAVLRLFGGSVSADHMQLFRRYSVGSINSRNRMLLRQGF